MAVNSYNYHLYFFIWTLKSNKNYAVILFRQSSNVSDEDFDDDFEDDDDFTSEQHYQFTPEKSPKGKRGRKKSSEGESTKKKYKKRGRKHSPDKKKPVRVPIVC